MPLVQFVEYELDTDFALLAATQTGHQIERPDSMTYATSASGAIGMTCGTRYANTQVRLERWDGRPPPAADDWEDVDELPWATDPDGGTVVAAGFDPPDTDSGLRVADLPRARVEVLARGRHRYSYSDADPEHLPPEQWLLRWWPDPSRSDALAGPPRRLAGPPPFWHPRSGWQAALHAWAQTGWEARLRPVDAFREIHLSLMRLGRPSTADELAATWGPWGTVRDEHGPYTLDTAVLGHPPRHELPEFHVNLENELLGALASAADMQGIDTFGDALHALHRLDLLLVAGRPGAERYAPNPAPRPVWDVLDVPPSSRHGLITQALYSDYRAYQADVEHIVRWAHPEFRPTTPLTIAVRLALPVHVVLGTLQLLQHLGHVQIDSADEPLEPASEMSLLPRQTPGAV